MKTKTFLQWFFLLVLLAGLVSPSPVAKAAQPEQSSEVTAFDLIIAMNTLRTSYGLPALVEDPIIDAVAQSTAEIMAANQMSWHIGDASGQGGLGRLWGWSESVGHREFRGGQHVD